MSNCLDFYAECGEPSVDDITEIAKLDNFSPYEKFLRLSLAETTDFKELSRAFYRKFILKGVFNKQCIDNDLSLLGPLLKETDSEKSSNLLPKFSWSIRFKFKLAKPYLSRDDASFYPIDNPIRKEKAFKVPMISGGQWKGTLRATAVRKLLLENSSCKDNQFAEKFAQIRWQLLFLFGTEKENMKTVLDDANAKAREKFEKNITSKFGPIKDESKESFQAGRLRFQPSFFNQIGLEVINPHDRKRKVGVNPIYMESIPMRSEAEFKMTYTPCDLMGESRQLLAHKAGQDLCLMAETIRDAFTLFGFGAKISSGFGLAEESFVEDGEIWAKVEEIPEKSEVPVRPEKPAELAEFLNSFPDETFELKGKEWRQKNGQSKSKMKLYMSARNAFKAHGEELERFNEKPRQTETSPTPPDAITIRPIKDFQQLCQISTELAAAWREKNE